MMASVRLRGIRKNYGDNPVIKGIDLDIDDGQFVVFVGPSGCGKSTLLRIIAGLEGVTEGQLEIDGGPASTSRRRSAASPWCSRATRCTRT
jgi:multiple sugar transport system ATP-binding protein